MRYSASEGTANGPPAKGGIDLTRNEEIWIEVIRQASRDADPTPTLERVRKVRAILRE